METYLRGFPGLDREAALWLVRQGVGNIGCDARSIDNPVTERYDSDPPCPVHTVCRDHRILNTENLAIPARLCGRRFRFIALPLKIRGGSASPIRAVALLE
jgi:kynurenine formamidase